MRVTSALEAPVAHGRIASPSYQWIDCPICESSDALKRLDVLSDGHGVVRCGRCGMLFLNPHYDADSLDRFYAPKEISVERVWGLPFDARSFDVAAYDRSGTARDMRRRLALVQKHVPRGRLLDVGCSIGLLLFEAQRAGYEAVGLDLSAKLAAYAREVVKVDARVGSLETLSATLGRFDAIVLWDVLEHLPFPGFTLSLINTHLEPGGCLFVHIPNANGLGNAWKTWVSERGLRAPEKRWSHFGIPFHLMWFTPATARRLVEKLGYEWVEHGAWSHLRKEAAPSFAKQLANWPLEKSVRTSYFWFVVRKVAEPPAHRLVLPEALRV